MSSPEDPRAEYHRHVQRRQTTVIGTVAAIMAGMVAIGMLVWTGVVPLSGPAFSRAEPLETYDPAPCPPAGATTVDLTTLSIKIYNGSETAGLAGTVEEVLTDAGLTVAETEDWDQEFRGSVQIRVSQAGLTNAYSLLQVFPDALVQLDSSIDDSDASVSLVLGEDYAHSMLTSDEIELIGSGQTITAPSGCVAVSSASPSASPTKG